MVVIEDRLLYLNEVPDGMKLLESHTNEIAAKANRIDEMVGRLETMPVHELLVKLDALEDKATISSGFEHSDSSMDFVTLMEEHIEGLDNAQQVIV